MLKLNDKGVEVVAAKSMLYAVMGLNNFGNYSNKIMVTNCFSRIMINLQDRS